MSDSFQYDITFIKNELKHMSPSEYVKRYQEVLAIHTWGAAGHLIVALMNQMVKLIDKAEGSKR